MKRKLFILLLVLPPVLLIAFIGFRRAAPKGPSTFRYATDVNTTYQRALKRWSEGHYKQVESGGLRGECQSFVARSGGTDLTAQQRDQLEESICDLINAYNNGSFETYMHFRAPVTNFIYLSESIKWQKDLLAKRYLKKGETLPKDPAAIHELMWERNFGGGAFSNYWQAVDWGESKLQIEDISKIQQTLRELVKHSENAGVATLIPTLQFQPDLDEQLSKGETVRIATVTLFLELQKPDPPYPVFCRFYWVPAYTKWLPTALVSAYVGPQARMPLF